ncbi:MAG TPA: hypothetical protein VGJ07_06155 [Rugosimonospora sp.]
MPLVAAAVCPGPPLLIPEIAVGAAAELDDLRAACDGAVGRLLAARPDGILIVGTGAETSWRRPDEYGTFAPWGVLLEIVPGRRGHPTLPLSLMIGAWLLGRSAELAPPVAAPPASTAPPIAAPPASTEPSGTTAPAGTEPTGTEPAGTTEPAGGPAPVIATAAVAAGGPIAVGMASVAAGEPPAGAAAFGRDRCAPWRPRVALLVVGDGSAYRPYPPSYGDPRAQLFDAVAAKALATADGGALLALDPSLAGDLMVTGRPVWQALAGAASGADWRGELLYDAAPYGVGYLVAAWESA